MQPSLRLLAALALVIVSMFGYEAFADDSEPAYLELRETTANRYNLSWRVPLISGRRAQLELQFGEHVRNLTEPVLQQLPGSVVERRLIETGLNGMVGERIEIRGLQVTNIDVIVRVEFANGVSSTELLKPAQRWLIVEGPRSSEQVAWDYTVLGVEHILAGFDHLLFVLALVLIVGSARRLLITITAFTIAHSITLAAATLGLVAAPRPPVEAVIALSIMFLANELIKITRGLPSLTARHPWVVAFGFGLLHGMGFAGALSEIGLPQHEIPLALLMFNVGVEAGQVTFVAGILVLIYALKRLRKDWPAWSTYLPTYGIGSMAAFWFVERLTGF